MDGRTGFEPVTHGVKGQQVTATTSPINLGASRGIRTHTDWLLRPVTLPVGLERHYLGSPCRNRTCSIEVCKTTAFPLGEGTETRAGHDSGWVRAVDKTDLSGVTPP